MAIVHFVNYKKGTQSRAAMRGVMLYVMQEKKTAYVDKDFSTIVNRNPDTYMSKAEQHHRLKTPDYFKYSIREGYQYV